MEIQQISRQAVEASAVLLKNQGMLPLAPGKQVAFFGWAQWDPVLSGNGSGASHSGRNPSFVESCREAGLEAVPALADFYKQWVEQEKATKAPAMELPQLKEAVNSGLMYELFGKYNPNPQEPAIRPRSCWRRPPHRPTPPCGCSGRTLRRRGVRPPPGERLLPCLSRRKRC